MAWVQGWDESVPDQRQGGWRHICRTTAPGYQQAQPGGRRSQRSCLCGVEWLACRHHVHPSACQDAGDCTLSYADVSIPILSCCLETAIVRVLVLRRLLALGSYTDAALLLSFTDRVSLKGADGDKGKYNLRPGV